MAELCGLCQKNDGVNYFSGVRLCNECKLGYLNSLKGNVDSLLYYGDVENFPNASDEAKQRIVEYLYSKLPDEIRLEKEREKERAIKRQAYSERRFKDDQLKKRGYEGYYEFKILNICDSRTGGVDLDLMLAELNKLGREGWQIKCAFSNELGKNSTSVGIGGFKTGTNATIEQSILILERFVRFEA